MEPKREKCKQSPENLVPKPWYPAVGTETEGAGTVKAQEPRQQYRNQDLTEKSVPVQTLLLTSTLIVVYEELIDVVQCLLWIVVTSVNRNLLYPIYEVSLAKSAHTQMGLWDALIIKCHNSIRFVG